MLILSRKKLARLYIKQSKSVQEIADIFRCSPNKIRYWMEKFNIETRSISEAIYRKNNPHGDPFKIKYPSKLKEAILFGLGLGLYWGEGTKADKVSVRLGNSDRDLIKKFIDFLVKIFNVKKKDFKFSLQLFNDINESEAVDYWAKYLKIAKDQFYKCTVTKSVRKGTYGKKSEYGVLTVYYHNKKMRDALMNILEAEKIK
jgi:hypothetical protein